MIQRYKQWRAVAFVQKIGYGSIEVTIHEGRITQIGKREKLLMFQDKNITK